MNSRQRTRRPLQSGLNMEQKIAAAKLARAAIRFDEGIEIYGSEEARLLSLDCSTREEAIEMLSHVQEVSLRVENGEYVVE